MTIAPAGDAGALATAVIARLGRAGVPSWMVHVDRLDEARLSIHGGGAEVARGTGECVSGALAWGRRVAGFSLGFAPDERRGIPSAIGARVASLERAATVGALPRVRAGVALDDSPEWSALVGRCLDELVRAASDAPDVDIELVIERREIVLGDHRGRWRHARRHAARLGLVADGGAWTLCLDALADLRVAESIARYAPVLRRARARARRLPPGAGRVRLRPTALAQLLARAPDLFGETVRDRRPREPPHDSAFPLVGDRERWLPAGRAPRAPPALDVWTVDDLVAEQDTLHIVGRAFDALDRPFARVAVEIPLALLAAALRSPARRGAAREALHLVGVDYRLPAIDLGVLPWRSI